MPNVPISGLPLTTSVCPTALIPIVQNGVTCSTYACLLGGGGGGGAVSQITAGTGITISPACGTGNVTICSTAVLPAVGSFTTCVSSPVVCGTTCVASPLLCGTTSICTPTLVSTNACITSLNTLGCAVCVGTGGQLQAFTPSGGIITAGTGCNSTLRCGVNNLASGNYAFAGGGCNNIASCNYSFVGAGYCNQSVCTNSFLGSGLCNCVCGNFSNIINGCNNCDKWICVQQTICCGLPIFVCCDSKFNNILNGCNNKSCGYFNNIINGDTNQICGIGCGLNSCGSSSNTILNGCCITIFGCDNTILNGTTNQIFGGSSIIGNGFNHLLCGGYTTILNGYQNQTYSNSFFNTIINGCGNNIGGCFNTVSGTFNNSLSCFGVLLGNCLDANGCHQYYFGETICNPYSASYQFAFGCNLCVGATCPMAYFNNVCVCGTLTKGSGFFKIPHPDPIKAEAGKFLKHSFVESPTAGDNIYRYNVTTSNCSASIDLPDYYNLLNGDDQVYVNAKNHLGYGFGVINKEQTKVDITTNSDGDYNVLIIGTRKDKLALDSWNGSEVEANEQKK